MSATPGAFSHNGKSEIAQPDDAAPFLPLEQLDEAARPSLSPWQIEEYTSAMIATQRDSDYADDDDCWMALDVEPQAVEAVEVKSSNRQRRRRRRGIPDIRPAALTAMEQYNNEMKATAGEPSGLNDQRDPQYQASSCRGGRNRRNGVYQHRPELRQSLQELLAWADHSLVDQVLEAESYAKHDAACRTMEVVICDA